MFPSTAKTKCTIVSSVVAKRLFGVLYRSCNLCRLIQRLIHKYSASLRTRGTAIVVFLVAEVSRTCYFTHSKLFCFAKNVIRKPNYSFKLHVHILSSRSLEKSREALFEWPECASSKAYIEVLERKNQQKPQTHFKITAPQSKWKHSTCRKHKLTGVAASDFLICKKLYVLILPLWVAKSRRNY